MLNDMYSLVESVVGSALLIWGVAILVNRHIITSFFSTFTNIEENETLSYLTASMFLILGLIVIFVHNDWYWSFGIIVTFVGWFLSFKASLWLFFPQYIAKWGKKFSHVLLSNWFRFAYGATITLLGLLVISKYFIENFIS